MDEFFVSKPTRETYAPPLILSVRSVGVETALSQTPGRTECGAARSREGWILLTFAREKNDGRRGGPGRNIENDDIDTASPKSRKKRADSPEVGQALRTVYQRTIEEDIPPDLLDLLGKLG